MIKMDSFIPVNPNEAPLSKEECTAAVAELYTAYKQFRAVNRRFDDPYRYGEPRYVLFSYVKSAGATADKDGFLGVAKIRGAFHTEREAAEKAEDLIKNVDSTNSIYTAMMGVPFPLINKGHASELTEVDISNKIEKVISDNVKAKRKEEEKEIKAIEERRKALVTDDGVTITQSEDPAETYVQLRVKLAHLRYGIKEHTAKANECISMEKNVRQQIIESATKHPEYEDEFIKRYQAGRRKANVPENTDFGGFMKYLLDPINPDENSKNTIEIIPSYIS